MSNRLKIDDILLLAGKETAKPSTNFIRSLQVSMDNEAKVLDDVTNKFFGHMYSGSPRIRYLSKINDWRETHDVKSSNLKKEVAEARLKCKWIFKSLL